MFGMTDTAISIYITQIPIALAILLGAILINQVKNVLVNIFNKQIEINKQNQEMLKKIMELYKKRRFEK